jgi:hypothetical protein
MDSAPPGFLDACARVDGVKAASFIAANPALVRSVHTALLLELYSNALREDCGEAVCVYVSIGVVTPEDAFAAASEFVVVVDDEDVPAVHVLHALVVRYPCLLDLGRHSFLLWHAATCGHGFLFDRVVTHLERYEDGKKREILGICGECGSRACDERAYGERMCSGLPLLTMAATSCCALSMCGALLRAAPWLVYEKIAGNGMTALQVAARAGEAEVVALLCTANRDAVNTADVYGQRPLHVAVRAGFIECVRVLLQNGASFQGDADLLKAAATEVPSTLVAFIEHVDKDGARQILDTLGDTELYGPTWVRVIEKMQGDVDWSRVPKPLPQLVEVAENVARHCSSEAREEIYTRLDPEDARVFRLLFAA